MHVIKMKIHDLIKEYNIETNIPETLREHEIEMIMPPVNQYTYLQKDNKHILSKISGNITDTITIDDNEQSISILKEPEGLRANFYKIYADGREEIA